MRTISYGQDGSEVAECDPRPEPTTDYGMLEPTTNVGGENPHPVATNATREGHPVSRVRVLIAVSFVVWVLGLVVALMTARSQWTELADFRQSKPASANDTQALDRLKPQRQAEALLEMALGHSDGAVEQISARVDRWQGKVQWNPQIQSLTMAALNSDDMRVRESGVEVELAAYGLAKSRASLDYVMQEAESSDHARKIWALWALGLMANRKVQPEYAVNMLAVHLQDKDEDSRMWAVEGLALSGTERALRTLLRAMHDDASLKIREAAACGVAQSGMFSPEQQMTAVPVLVKYAGDPSLDAATHAWAFHALADITHQRLGNNAETWRRWYEEQGPEIRP